MSPRSRAAALGWLFVACEAAFAASPQAPSGYTGHAVHLVFQRYDADKDGSISRQEWARYASDGTDLPAAVATGERLGEAQLAEEAARWFPRRRVADHPDIRAVFERGLSLARTQSWSEATELFAEATRRLEGVEASYLALASSLESSGRQREARDALHHAVSVLPASPELWRRLAEMEEKLGDEPAAAEARRRVSRLGDFARLVPNRSVPTGRSPTGAVDLLTDCGLEQQMRGRDYAGALALARADAALPGAGWQPYLACASLLAASRRGAEAGAALGDASARGAPAASAAALRVGLELDAGDRGAARAQLSSLSEQASQAEQLYEAAWQLSLRRDWELAIPLLRRCNLQFHEPAPVTLLLAIALYESGEPQSACELVDHSAEAITRYPDGYPALARLCVAIGRVEPGLVAMQEAAENGQDAWKWLCLARARQVVGHREEQRQALRNALRLAPQGSPLRQEIRRSLEALPPEPPSPARNTEAPGATGNPLPPPPGME